MNLALHVENLIYYGGLPKQLLMKLSQSSGANEPVRKNGEYILNVIKLIRIFIFGFKFFLKIVNRE